MYRLVMTDIQMPDVDGFMVALRILATQRNWFEQIGKSSKIGKFKTRKECSVIAVTAFTDEETVKTALKAGIKQVINKPVSYDQLKAIIKENYIF